MRPFLKMFAAAGLLLLGTTASAQYRPRDEYRYQDRERRDRFFEQLRSDLYTAERSTLPLTGDRNRIERAQQELNALERQMDLGNYDRRTFDETIRAMERVVNDNLSLSNQTWDSLAADLSRLRDFENRFDR
jgi:hypothetical protein